MVKAIDIDDSKIKFCKGCKRFYKTAKCVYNDGGSDMINEIRAVDRIVIVAPSYWRIFPGNSKIYRQRYEFCMRQA